MLGLSVHVGLRRDLFPCQRDDADGRIKLVRSSLIACFCFLCSLSNRVTLCPVEDGLVWVLQGLTGGRIAPTNVLDEFLMTDVDCEAKKVTTVAILQEEEGCSQ